MKDTTPTRGNAYLRQPDAHADQWAATLAVAAPATRMVGDEDEYLGNATREVGRRISDVRHEIFVVCAPAEALQQQLDHLSPEFLAVHDLGGDAATRLLQCLAGAAGGKLQQLVIRRQGFGDALATLSFVELPGPRGKPGPRVYSCRAEASDPGQRTALARVLLAHSRLGALLVDEQPVGQADQALQPLHDALMTDGWRNRHLLWMPIGAGAPTRALAGLIGHRHGLNLHTVATLPGVAQAWPIILNLWHQLRSGDASAAIRLPASAMPAEPAAPARATAGPVAPADDTVAAGEMPGRASAMALTAPMPLRPMPAVSPAAVPPSSGAPTAWTRYVRDCAVIQGMVSCCVFELASQRTLAHAGTRPGPASLASHGAALVDAMLATARALGLPSGRPDLAITFQEHHLILHPLPQHPGLVLHAVLDAHVANLTLARMKLQRLDPPAEA